MFLIQNSKTETNFRANKSILTNFKGKRIGVFEKEINCKSK